MSRQDDEQVIELGTSDSLDLHTFAPKDAAAVTEAWLDECKRRGHTEVRLIHGKGIGQLRRQVHAVLRRHPAVESFRTAGEGRGGWGATIVVLKKTSS